MLVRLPKAWCWSRTGGFETTALLTDMNEPLASAAGNAVEMQNAVDFLKGTAIDNRLWDVTVAQGGELLASGASLLMQRPVLA